MSESDDSSSEESSKCDLDHKQIKIWNYEYEDHEWVDSDIKTLIKELSKAGLSPSKSCQNKFKQKYYQDESIWLSFCMANDYDQFIRIMITGLKPDSDKYKRIIGIGVNAWESFIVDAGFEHHYHLLHTITFPRQDYDYVLEILMKHNTFNFFAT